MKRGLFITFEGVEGVGKSTQIQLVREYFSKKSTPFFLTREPGGSPLSDAIRGVLLKSSAGFQIDPIAELFLIEAARRQHVVDVLFKALQTNELVLCDRFYDSTLAYQGGGRGIDLKFIETLNQHATDGLRPDLTILLDMPMEEALTRALKRISKVSSVDAEDRFEREDKTFHARIKETYLKLAKAEPQRFFLVDGSGKKEDIARAIIAKIESLLSARK